MQSRLENLKCDTMREGTKFNKSFYRLQAIELKDKNRPQGLPFSHGLSKFSYFSHIGRKEWLEIPYQSLCFFLASVNIDRLMQQLNKANNIKAFFRPKVFI